MKSYRFHKVPDAAARPGNDNILQPKRLRGKKSYLFHNFLQNVTYKGFLPIESTIKGSKSSDDFV